MKIPLLDLKAQYAAIKNEIRPVIDEICDAQGFILGPKVENFEKNMAKYCRVKHAIGISSGTDAILVALMAHGIGPGDAVITTPYSFFATIGCISRLGATPVLADINPATFNLDPLKTEQVLSRVEREGKLKAKVILPVHLYGQSADMDGIMSLAKEYGVKVIEDACQAIGAEYPSKNGPRKVGSIGDAGCFSFFPSKNLGGFGDGGMATTNDSELADRIVKLRNHGMHPKYYHKMIGGNFRLDALQAGVLDVKLNHLETWHEARMRNAARYNARFKGTAVKTPDAVYANSGLTNFHIYNQYVVRVKDRDKVLAKMKAADIGCEVYYPVPLHLQECFAYLGYKEGDFPESESAAKETLALPIYPELTPEMQNYVADILLK